MNDEHVADAVEALATAQRTIDALHARNSRLEGAINAINSIAERAIVTGIGQRSALRAIVSLINATKETR